MKKVLITGASSYVGARLYYDLQKRFEVVGTYYKTRLSDAFLKLDTTDAKQVQKLIREVHPNIVIHAASNASAKWCEEHPQKARILNEKATKSVMDAAQTVNAGIIFISSFAAADTSNIYGQTKAASEQVVREMDRWIILRPSLVIGLSPNTTNDRPFNRILKNIDEGTLAIYDTSWKFQPSFLGHISEVITLVIDREINAHTIPIAVSALKSRFDIAKDILWEFGIKVTPVDNHDKTLVIEDDLNKLKELDLPIYQYDQIIRTIINEIKHRERFHL